MPVIHPTAIIGNDVHLDETVEIGPYSVIEDHVTIGAGTVLRGQCRVCSYTTIGKNNTIYPFACVGGDPHDYSFDLKNGPSYTEIGDNNLIHECATVHRGAHPGTKTIVGSNCFLMAMSHVAHNCIIGDYAILASNALCAGYVEVGAHALISGNTSVHQFCRVGRYAVLSGNSAISVDLPPFMIGDGRNGGVRAFNKVGLSRAGWSREQIRQMHNLYDVFFRRGLNVSNAIKLVETEFEQTPEIVEFLDFVKSTKRGILSGGSTRRC